MTNILSFKPYASKFFQTNGVAPLYVVPRYKFMYYAQFNVNPVALQKMQKTLDPSLSDGKYNGWQDQSSVSFLIKQLDRPKIDLQSQESNQYGRRKHNYTRVQYQDLSMRLYDTSDNRVLNMWINYFRYYFADTRKSPAESKSVLQPSDPMYSAAGYGFSPVTDWGVPRQFFDSISIYAIFKGTAQVTKLISPKISSIDWGTFESNDSSPTEVGIRFKYESIEYDTVDLESAALLAPMGLDGASLDPPGAVSYEDTFKDPSIDTTVPDGYSLPANFSNTALQPGVQNTLDPMSANSLTIPQLAVNTPTPNAGTFGSLNFGA